MSAEAALVMQGVGTVAQARGQRQAANAQATANRNNANLARQNARETLRATGRSEARVRREGRRDLASQAAAIGKSGVTFSGSILDVIEDSTRIVEENALDERIKGTTAARDYLLQAANLDAGASDAALAGRNAATATLIAGSAKLASGIASYGG